MRASSAVTMSVANLSTEPLLKFGSPEQKENGWWDLPKDRFSARLL